MAEAGRWSWLGWIRTKWEMWHQAPRQWILPRKLRCCSCTPALSSSHCSSSPHSEVLESFWNNKIVSDKKTGWHQSLSLRNEHLRGQWHLQPHRSNWELRVQLWVHRSGSPRWAPTRLPPPSRSHCPMGASLWCRNTLSPLSPIVLRCPRRRLAK